MGYVVLQYVMHTYIMPLVRQIFCGVFSCLGPREYKCPLSNLEIKGVTGATVFLLISYFSALDLHPTSLSHSLSLGPYPSSSVSNLSLLSPTPYLEHSTPDTLWDFNG